MSNSPAGPLAFSYSKLSLYEECPLKYKFKYIDKLKEEPKSYFAFGNSIHTALEFLYSVKAPPFPTLAETLEAFKQDWNRKTWAEKGYRQARWADMDYDKGCAMLTAYYAHNKAAFSPPFQVEYATDVEVDGLKVRIIADRIEHRGGGVIEIVDYKTGKDVKRVPDQLHMYQKISELDPLLREKLAEAYGLRVAAVKIGRLLYYHVPTLKEYEFARADDREIGVFWDRVLGVAEQIRGARFEPTPGERQCAWCDFKKFCPLFSPEARVTQPELEAPAEPLALLADRYGRLKRKRDELGAELEDLAEQLRAGAGASGEADIEGREFLVKLRKASVFSPGNRDAVIEALKRHGLYERALALTQSGLAALLKEDSDIPVAARRDLLALAGEKTEIKAEAKE